MAPVFFVLILGIMEIGLAMNDKLAVASTVRAGSRVASASGNDLSADLYTIFQLGKESAAIKKADIDYVVIYKPAKFGEEPSQNCRDGLPQPGVCNVYRAADFNKAAVQVKEETAALAANRAPDPAKIFFGCKANVSPDRYWCPTSRKVAQIVTGPEYVGVYMKIQHKWVTKMFGNAQAFTDQSVIRLEPRVS